LKRSLLCLLVVAGIAFAALAPSTQANDGRFCYGPGQVEAAIYADGKGGIDFYAIDTQNIGVKVFNVSAIELSRLPEKLEKPVLIKENTKYIDLAFYKLPSGEYQINAGPNHDGEVFACIFETAAPATVRIDTFKIGQ
jgi:hypothetical protein